MIFPNGLYPATGTNINQPLPFQTIADDDGIARLVACVKCDVLWSPKLEDCCWICGGTEVRLSLLRDVYKDE